MDVLEFFFACCETLRRCGGVVVVDVDVDVAFVIVVSGVGNGVAGYVVDGKRNWQM